MALRDYLASEVGEDWTDGMITRREAVRRLLLLGLSAPAAAALLAACADSDGDRAAPTSSSPPTSTPTTAATPTTATAAGSTTTAAPAVAPVPVTFPGPAGELMGSFAGSKATVLGVYAELDSRVNASKEAMEAALTTAGLTHELRVLPGVDHAFFNETGQRYNPDQAAAAYQATLAGSTATCASGRPPFGA